ncbi:hypothetical protein AN958_02819 [Leucoagaricus sp. SymC.cos]|nr:hypothetical protein AN958_02819 [Leucoagaricus sp. SymC.cos]
MAFVSLSEFPPQNPGASSRNGNDKDTSQINVPIANVAQFSSNLPVVALDVDVLTDIIAARLATSLLGHVLFLKNQIPLPILQLARLPSSKGNTKATKLKTDLLSAFDTLTSHLVTTFSALSTALASTPSSVTQVRELEFS